MERFEFYNSQGKSIIFSTNPTLFEMDNSSSLYVWLQSATGLSDCDIIAPTSRAYNQNGYTLKNINVGKRVITLQFYIYNLYFVDATDVNYARQQVCHILNPLLGEGRLIYNNGEKTYTINCYCSQLPKANKITNNYMELWTVEFIADNPFWQGNGRIVMDNFRTLDVGTYEGYFDDAYTVGDIEAPFEIGFSTAGYKAEIKLVAFDDQENETVLHTFSFDTPYTGISSFTITTDYGNKNLWVKVNGVDKLANRYITNDDFFQIPFKSDDVDYQIVWKIWINETTLEFSSVFYSMNDSFVGV